MSYIHNFTFCVTQISYSEDDVPPLPPPVSPPSLPPPGGNGSSVQQAVPGGSQQQPSCWLRKRKDNEQHKGSRKRVKREVKIKGIVSRYKRS